MLEHNFSFSKFYSLAMDKLKLTVTGQTQGRVFNFRSNFVHTTHSLHSVAVWLNLDLKTWPKQLLGYLPLDILLPALALFIIWCNFYFGMLSKGVQLY